MNLDGREEPENRYYRDFSEKYKLKPEKVVDDLDPTEDGESCKKAHGASYKAQLCLHCHLWIIINNIS